MNRQHSQLQENQEHPSMSPKREGEKLRERGLSHHKQGDLIYAEQCYRQAMSTGYIDQLMLINLGDICKETGRLAEALFLYQNAIKVGPDNPVPYGNISNLYGKLGRFDKALIATLKSQELSPNNPDIHMSLGDIYKELGKLDQALNSILKSQRLRPGNPDIYMNLGLIYLELGELDQALTSTLKSIALRPENPDAEMNLGIIYEVNHEKEKALEHYLISAKLFDKYKKNSSVSCIISALLVMIQLGNIQEAKKNLIHIPRLREKAKKDSVDYSQKNKKHDDGYFVYITELLKEMPEDLGSNTSKSIHIGESHSLAFTNQIISINGIKSIIKPELVKGAKAWHLANSQINLQKICFQNAITEKLGNYKSILLSFGEIDYRQDEGILQHCIKKI